MQRVRDGVITGHKNDKRSESRVERERRKSIVVAISMRSHGLELKRVQSPCTQVTHAAYLTRDLLFLC